MIRKQWLLILLALVMAVLLAGCTTDSQTQEQIEAETTERTVEKVPVEDINALAITDPATLYAQQDPTSLMYFYITVKGGNAADKTDHTLQEVNAYLNLQGMQNVEKIKTEIMFQVGDQYGPMPGAFGYGETISNATMNVRGRSSTSAPQKSYRIDLFDNAGLWQGQRAIALNKHPYDKTRLRNMLFFTLLQKVPDITSLRTQFVQVFVKDETSGETAFTDYGLFTRGRNPQRPLSAQPHAQPRRQPVQGEHVRILPLRGSASPGNRSAVRPGGVFAGSGAQNHARSYQADRDAGKR